MASKSGRAISAAEARDFLRASGRRKLTGVVFPEIEFSGDLRDLEIADSDLTGVWLRPSILGARAIRDCSFEAVLFSNLQLRKRLIIDSEFRSCQFGGMVVESRFERSSILSSRFRDVTLLHVGFSGCQIADLDARGMTWKDGGALGTRLSGTIDNVNWSRLRFDNVDLRNLRMYQTDLVDCTGDALLPEFEDSYVIQFATLKSCRAAIAAQISSESLEAYDALVRSEEGPEHLVVIDRAAIEHADPTKPGVIPDLERDRILEILHAQRLSDLPAR